MPMDRVKIEARLSGGVGVVRQNKLRVAVGLSGGVDSAVSAYLLKKQGYEVTGVHLVCWDGGVECKASKDRQDALRVAMTLGVPFEVLDFQKEYKERVIDRFYDDYAKGLTPNPDVWCNSEIKFGMFMEWAVRQGFDYIATGHYAKVERVEIRPPGLRRGGRAGLQGYEPCEGRVKLVVPKDRKKDQTYFLYRLGQRELLGVIFPLGDYLKKEVREIAREAGLPVANKKDSQGICFVGDVDVNEFLQRRLKEREGEVVVRKSKRQKVKCKNIVSVADFEVVGRHKGVWFYTIGQRGGWEVRREYQKKFGGEIPVFYVIDKEVERNRLVVGFGAETYRDGLEVKDLSWVRGEEKRIDGVKVRIRHGGALIKAKVRVKGTVGRLEVELKEAQRGVSPGQAAVFYDGEEVLGGGVIV